MGNVNYQLLSLGYQKMMTVGCAHKRSGEETMGERTEGHEGSKMVEEWNKMGMKEIF
jgi:hypothetical protein